jgi:hypothetical protein
MSILLQRLRRLRGARAVAGLRRTLGDSGLFDAVWYVARYPDVEAAGVDPLSHYISTGEAEGRWPNPDFDPAFYMSRHDDVRAAKTSPLLHYVSFGRAEGRATSPEALKSGPAEPSGATGSVASSQDLRAALSTMKAGGGRGLLVSVSHDDFTRIAGGMQLCLRRESEAVGAMGYDRLHIFPIQPAATVIQEADPSLGVLMNGQFVGDHRASVLSAAIRATDLAGFGRRFCAIHSLIGHDVQAVMEVFQAARVERGFFWIHDFAAACSGPHLMLNDAGFCGAPPVDGPTCGQCKYGSRRRFQMEAHRQVFEKLDLEFLAPSDLAAEIWKTATGATSTEVRVHPHCHLIAQIGAGDVGARSDKAAGPIRVAFAGLPSFHKGWPAYRRLASRYAESEQFAFYHFGAWTDHDEGIAFVPITADPHEPDRMRRALVDHEIDVVLVWSICPETFCFVAYEGAAAGAMLATAASAGNAVRFTQDGHGVALADEQALHALFDTGLAEAVSGWRDRRRPSAIAYSGMSADFLPALAAGARP